MHSIKGTMHATCVLGKKLFQLMEYSKFLCEWWTGNNYAIYIIVNVKVRISENSNGDEVGREIKM